MSRVKKLILGTAGHIDHGKTSLVRALTGIDCDRLPEEKQRGITIDIGFAHLGVDDLHIGIVDVPGHERFIKNMLAGASGIDLVMLVVAADDSIMPQTREHLDILRLLDVRHGLIAITKCDLVEPGWLDMVEQDVWQLVRETFLTDAPIVRTSATSGTGIAELKRTIGDVCRRVGETPIGDVFRLAIDRAFVVQGRGTVVTGTVWSGRLRVGDEVEWLPLQKTLRVRGLQSHGQDVDEVIQGQRAAVALLGVHHTEIARGHELATVGYLKPSQLLTAHVTLLASSPRPLKHRACVRAHLGTQERIGTVALLDERNALQPGESAFAQIACDEPAIASGGQSFVIRSVSPLLTIGGGHVLQPAPPRLPRRDESVIARLNQLHSTDAGERSSATVYFYDLDDWTDLDLARDANVPPGIAPRNVVQLPAGGQHLFRIHRNALEQHEASILRVLDELHARSRLEKSIPRSRLAAALSRRGQPHVIGALIDRLIRAGQIVGDEQSIALPKFAPKLTAAQAQLRQRLLDAFAAAGLSPPDVTRVARDARAGDADLRPVVDLCVAEGQLVHVGDGMFLHRDAEAVLRDRVREIFNGYGNGALTLSRIREALGTSRKYALPLCEYLDRIGVTKRVGDERVLATK
jgi:selenocysteine-specific elongation factor